MFERATALQVAAIVWGLTAGILLVSGGRPVWFLAVWNAVGLVDIVAVVMAVFREGLRDRGSVAVIREFPLSLLPTFFVPLILASHGIIFVRLRREKAAADARRQRPLEPRAGQSLRR